MLAKTDRLEEGVAELLGEEAVDVEGHGVVDDLQHVTDRPEYLRANWPVRYGRDWYRWRVMLAFGADPLSRSTFSLLRDSVFGNAYKRVFFGCFESITQ